MAAKSWKSGEALVHGTRARIDHNGVHAAVVADDPDLVHRAVALFDGLSAHDAPGITALRKLNRFGERELATLRQLRRAWRDRREAHPAVGRMCARRLAEDGAREAE